MSCNHPHGDTVNGFWLCGKCYEKLPERPVEYKNVMVSTVATRCEDPKPPKWRQEAFPAPTIRAASGLTLSEFVHIIARRIMAKTPMEKVDALDYAIDILDMAGEEFGDPSMDWDTESAWELVSEDMQYWDEDSEDGNE